MSSSDSTIHAKTSNGEIIYHVPQANILFDDDKILAELMKKDPKPSPNKPVQKKIPKYHLLSSTTLFLIPTLYAFMDPPLIYHGIVSIFTTLISWNHWRDYQHKSLARSLDLYFSKLSFIIYFITGSAFFLSKPSLFFLSVPSTYFMLQSYKYSINLYKVNDPKWVYAHMMFHAFVAYTQFLVLYCGKNYVLGEYPQIPS